MKSWLFACLFVLALPATVMAAKKDKKTDRIWTHPDIASFRIERIAMLPVSTYDKNASAEKAVESGVGLALRETGYRWISAGTTRDMLRAVSGGGDSLLKVAQKSVLDTGRLDSLMTPMFCGKLRVDAILAIRVDQWEQNQIEWDQSGKPNTSIQLRAALVDSAGTLLWSASGSQYGEGPHRDANSGAMGITGGALERKPVTGQGGAPSYQEVLAPMLARWVTQFPARAAAEAPAATSP